MNIIFLLIPLGLALLGIAIWAFVWAVNHDQFDDLDRAASSILFEEDTADPRPPCESDERATHEADTRHDG